MYVFTEEEYRACPIDGNCHAIFHCVIFFFFFPFFYVCDTYTLTCRNNEYARARTQQQVDNTESYITYTTHKSRCSFSSRDYTNNRAAWIVIRDAFDLFLLIVAPPCFIEHIRLVNPFFISFLYLPESRVLPCDHLSFSFLLFLTLRFHPPPCLIDACIRKNRLSARFNNQ